MWLYNRIHVGGEGEGCPRDSSWPTIDGGFTMDPSKFTYTKTWYLYCLLFFPLPGMPTQRSDCHEQCKTHSSQTSGWTSPVSICVAAGAAPWLAISIFFGVVVALQHDQSMHVPRRYMLGPAKCNFRCSARHILEMLFLRDGEKKFLWCVLSEQDVGHGVGNYTLASQS